MPFTLAHPAAAVPLRKPLGRLGVSGALVCGSVTPDIGYLIPWRIWPAPSHSLIGLFAFCLPVGLGLYAAFYLLLGPLLSVLSPRWLSNRYPTTWANGELPARRLVAVSASIVVGAATHLAWDSFTHEGGMAVRLLPALSTPLFTWEGYTLFTFKVLQHSSTILGLWLVSWWSLRWFRNQTPRGSGKAPSARIRAALILTLVGPPLGVAVTKGWHDQHTATGLLHRLQLFVAGGIFSGGTVLVVCLLIVSSIWRFRVVGRGA